MGMRFSSTPQSALNGEITKLAIIETILAVLIYVGIGLYFETIKHFVFAIAVAPLALLRSKRSAEWGLIKYQKYWNKLLFHYFVFNKRVDDWNTRFTNTSYFVTSLIGVVMLSVIGIVVRVIATVNWVIITPLITLTEMPRNWVRQALCTDSFHPPELVPLEAVKGKEFGVITFEDFFLEKRNKSSLLHFVIRTVLGVPLFLLAYLPSIVYRVSVKATSIFYWPFIFAVDMTLLNKGPLVFRLKRIKEGVPEKVRRWISSFIILGVALKIALIFDLVDLAYVAAQIPIQKANEFLFMSNALSFWKIGLVVDASLTFFLLFYVDSALARIDSSRVFSENKAQNLVSTVTYIRATIGILTISHLFYLIVIKPGYLGQMYADILLWLNA